MAANRPISSLFVSPWDANPRFAIEKYDSMFCRAGIELSGGDPGRVHLAFASLNQGRPYNLPEAVNVLKYDFLRANSTETEALLQYVRCHRIEFVQILDCQIIHPLIAKLRNSGARTII